jgi:hypothetical protein
LQFQRAGAGNVHHHESGRRTGALSDILQLSNDNAGNAFITALSDMENSGPDLSLLPVQDAGDLAGPFTESSPFGGGATLMGQVLNIATTIDGGPVIVSVPTTVILRSDGDPAGGTPDGGQSDFVAFIPAAPPVAVWALALILMGGGVYMARRQRIHRG